jgi:hypothetical protein
MKAAVMPIDVQIDGVRATIGRDKKSSMEWTSEDARLAADLNRYDRFPLYSEALYTPTPQLSEAEAVVKEAIDKGKKATIVADTTIRRKAAAAAGDDFNPSVLY